MNLATELEGATHTEAVIDLYLDLLKRILTRHSFMEKYKPIRLPLTDRRRVVFNSLNSLLSRGGLELVRQVAIDSEFRAQGRDWPADAETMVGLRRLENLEQCVREVIRKGVPGDLIETGVWRGGVTIFMRAILKAYGDARRTVWVADSFQGLPKPDAMRYPADAGDRHWTRQDALGVSLEQVKENFSRYGLLDEQVRFLVGWFRDTLPTAPIEQLAVLRLDGDMYESTMDALRALYPKLSIGGYLIVDDYGDIPGCRMAVEDYRAEHGLTEPIETIDKGGVFWKRQR